MTIKEMIEWCEEQRDKASEREGNHAKAVVVKLVNDHDENRLRKEVGMACYEQGQSCSYQHMINHLKSLRFERQVDEEGGDLHD